MEYYNPFHGSGVALATPFHADGTIDWVALKNIINNLLDGGVDFICVLGTTAETPTLTLQEQEEIKIFVKETVAGAVPLLLGAGSNDTAEVCKKLKEQSLDGYSGVLLVAPFYNKPTQRGLYAHYRAISEVSPVPIMLYNVPSRTGVNLEADTVLRLAADCSNIVAIKEASGRKEQILRLIAEAPKGFDIISGDDALTHELIKAGAKGVISVINNAFPSLFSQMVHYTMQGDIEKALQTDTLLRPMYSLLGKEGNPTGLKCVLAQLGICEDVLRLPLVSVSETTRKEISEEIKRLK